MSPRAHFKIFGIPVRVEPFFVIVAVLFGLRYNDIELILAWLVVTFVSVLVHEMGHALVYRAFGERSAIVLHFFGGFTVGSGRVALSKAQRIAVSVAGSAAALVLLWLPLRALDRSDWWLDQPLFVQALVTFGAFVNLWWSVANLLPIRPLDGGHVAEELLGLARARWLSIGIGVVAAVWALAHDHTYAAIFAGFLAFLNFSEMRAQERGAPIDNFDVSAPEPTGAIGGARRRRRGHLHPVPTSAPDLAPLVGEGDAARLRSLAWSALRDGDREAASRLGARLGSSDPWLQAALALDGGPGVDLYARAWEAHPDGPPSLAATEVLGRSGHAVSVAHRLLARGGTGNGAAATLQTHLHYAECFGPAAEVGEAVFAAGPTSPAQTAFEVACSWARAGDVERALLWLGRAADAGFRAERVVDGEPDLRTVRADPRWVDLRPRLV
ncbi:MAG: site-2 protease family protein [Acidimicrobiia bacterium]